MLTPPPPPCTAFNFFKETSCTEMSLKTFNVISRVTLFVLKQLGFNVHTVECDDCHERFPAKEAVDHSNTCPGGSSSSFFERRY